MPGDVQDLLANQRVSRRRGVGRYAFVGWALGAAALLTAAWMLNDPSAPPSSLEKGAAPDAAGDAAPTSAPAEAPSVPERPAPEAETPVSTQAEALDDAVLDEPLDPAEAPPAPDDETAPAAETAAAAFWRPTPLPGLYTPADETVAPEEFACFHPTDIPPVAPCLIALHEGRPLYGPVQEMVGVIQPNQFFEIALTGQGLDAAARYELTQALRGALDFRSMRPGHAWSLTRDTAGRPMRFEYRFNERDSAHAVRDAEGNWVAWKQIGEVERLVVPVAGVIRTNLSEAMAEQGEGVGLAVAFADVLAWDVDFSSDCRVGDEFRLLVEKRLYKGKLIGYGKILSASYKGAITGETFAHYFRSTDGKIADYYQPDGKSVRKSFLRAPLNTIRVTSRFGFRKHPVHGKYKAHNGVDFGAPKGTPVWAAADGVVTVAGWGGGCGKMVGIRHSSGYETVYCHLSAILVQRGQHVSQKRIVGKVGSTGVSTGPHLHYGLKYNGRWMNPMQVKFQPGPPLPPQYFGEYNVLRAEREWALRTVEVRVALGPEAPSGAETTPQAEAPMGESEFGAGDGVE